MILINNRVSKTIEALMANNFTVCYFESRDLLKDYLIENVDSKCSLAIGGSKTIEEIEIVNELKNSNRELYWHWLEEESLNEQILFKASKSDVYFMSANAITEDGKIINIDGLGNRISSLCYGHKEVYIVVGINKISTDIKSAIDRIKSEACPKNAERLNLNTPCRHTNKCFDCKSEDRMCNITCIIEKHPMKGKMNICIVNEILGY